MPSTSTTIHDIQQLVAAHWAVSVTDLVSARQTRAVVVPRHVAMWLARHCTTYSLPVIGHAFGGRDHSTVMNACRRIDDRMEQDDVLECTVGVLRDRLLRRQGVLA